MAQLTHVRIARFFETLNGKPEDMGRVPVRFNRASERLAVLAHKHGITEFWALSRACREHAHMVNLMRLPGCTEHAFAHSVNVGQEIRLAVQQSAKRLSA